VTTLNTFPIARKKHHCDGMQPDCAEVIEPGTRYLRSALPPNDGDVGNVGWLNNAYCPSCAEYYKTPVPEVTS
jgi:hypothetical protein